MDVDGDQHESGDDQAVQTGEGFHRGCFRFHCEPCEPVTSGQVAKRADKNIKKMQKRVRLISKRMHLTLFYMCKFLQRKQASADIHWLAVRDVAKARGVATIAAKAGLGRESLYKTLKPGAKPRFEAVVRLLDALGVKLGAVAPHSST